MVEVNTSREQILLEIEALKDKLEHFEQEKNELELSLEILSHHSDSLGHPLLAKLKKFQQKLAELEREKVDLQISLETVTEHTDQCTQELVLAHRLLTQEIARHSKALEEKNALLQKEIRERRRIEADLRLAATVFQASNEGIFITDEHARIINVNQAYVNITGYNKEESLGKNPEILKLGQYQSSQQNIWKIVRMTGYWCGEVWNRRKNDEIFPGWLSISTVTDEENHVTHYIGIFTDNTYQKRSEGQIYYLAHYDALTDLPNRILFEERLQQALRRAARDNHWVTILCIDLDHFKAINNAFGHPIGDQLLRMVAQRLLTVLPEGKDIVGRLGGDEFIIFLPDLASNAHSLQVASEIAERVIALIQNPFSLVGHEVFITVSIGITIYPQDGQGTAELLKNADAAMYDAKEHGRNSYQFFTEGMNITAHKRLTLQNNLRRAVERNQLMLYYQPQLDLQTEQVVGLEALLRWSHPQLGFVPPAEFIPLAENSGLINSIGQWVLQAACAQNRSWQAQGCTPVRIAVNLSVRQFYHDDLLKNVTQVLDQTGLAPRWLELEITESIAMSYADKAVDMLRALKGLGIDLAIDDFGTGYSSLNYLKQFAIDTLKIDGSFIAEIRKPKGAALVSAIINMAHNLCMKVIAEGVETPQQLAFLREEGCDLVQGFLFYKPMPPHEIGCLLPKENISPIH